MNNKTLYRRFCEQTFDLPIFVQAWYLDAVCLAGEWEVAVVIEQGEIVASLPYFTKRQYGFQYVTMPPFVKAMGPYISPAHRQLKKEHKLLKALIEQLPKLHVYKQNFHPTLTNWLPFYWEGYQQTTYYTYQIDLTQGLEAVYVNINRNMRRNIKKAASIVTIYEDLSPTEFYKINQKSFDRQSIAMPYSLDFFLGHDAALAKNSARKIFYAIDTEKHIHSVAYLIWDQHTAYYHLSGDDPDKRNSGAGIALIWYVIQYAAEQLKVSTFDFEGSIIPSIERIRVQFGARQTPYFFVWKYQSSFLYWLDVLKRNVIR